MAKRVVDVLEVVQVDQQQCHLFTRTTGTCQRLAHALAQEIAIGQAGQLVVVGQIADALFGPFLGPDLPPDATVAYEPIFTVDNRYTACTHPDLAVRAASLV